MSRWDGDNEHERESRRQSDAARPSNPYSVSDAKWDIGEEKYRELETKDAIGNAVMTKMVALMRPNIIKGINAAAQQIQSAGVGRGPGYSGYSIPATKAWHGSPGSDPDYRSDDEKSKSMGDWLKCIAAASMSQFDPQGVQLADERLKRIYKSAPSPDFSERYARAAHGMPAAKAALAEGIGTTGGYATPADYERRLFEIMAEDAILAGLCEQMPMTTREHKVPSLNQTVPPAAGNTSAYGGMSTQWIGEGADRIETEPSFRQISMVANELSGYAVVGRELLADNVVALEAVLPRIMAGAIGWYVDYALLRGNGVGKPLGIMNSPARLEVARATPNAFGIRDISKMWQTLPPRSQNRSVWFLAQTMIDPLLRLASADNRLVYMPYWPGGNDGTFQVTPNAQLLGRPVYFTEKVSPLGSTGDAMLIDPKMYLYGRRGGIEIQASEHALFTRNQIVFRFIFRCEGQPQLDAPYTYPDGVTQTSPFVVLAA